MSCCFGTVCVVVRIFVWCRRKRKRIHDTIQSLAQQTQSPALHKRRSSASDAGRLSVSGSFLDCTTSPVSKVNIMQRLFKR